MRLVRGIWISHFPTLERLVSELQALGIEPQAGDIVEGLGDWNWGTKLPANDPRIMKIEARFPIPQENIGLVMSCYAEYDQQELDEAELLEVSFAVTTREELAPFMGAQFDFRSACPNCGCGAVLLAGSGFPGNAFPKKRDYALTSGVAMLVRGPLLQDLCGVDSVKEALVQLRDNKSKAPLAWHAIWAKPTLPPAHLLSSGFELQKESRLTCGVCLRNRWGPVLDKPCEYVFSRLQIAKACHGSIPDGQTVPDVVSSWERRGYGSPVDGSEPVGRVPTPSTFVSQRIYRILRKHAKGHVRAVPVRLVP